MTSPGNPFRPSPSCSENVIDDVVCATTLQLRRSQPGSPPSMVSFVPGTLAAVSYAYASTSNVTFMTRFPYLPGTPPKA